MVLLPSQDVVVRLGRPEQVSDVLLIGEHNPRSSDPRVALYPRPPGCAGWRLWRLCCDGWRAEHYPGVFNQGDYLRTFWRCNADQLLATNPGRVDEVLWKLHEQGIGRIMLFGRTVAKSMLASDAAVALFTPHPEQSTVKVALVPHPSGRNRLYNEPRMRLAVARFMARLARDVRAGWPKSGKE